MVLIEDESLALRFEDLEEKMAQLADAKSFLASHAKSIDQLQKVASALEVDPEEFDALEAEYRAQDSQLQELKKRIFAVSDLVERRHHFLFRLA